MLSTQDQAAWSQTLQVVQRVGNHSDEAMMRDQVQKVDFFRHFTSQNNDMLEKWEKSLFRSYFMVWLRSALYYDGKQILIPRGNGGFGFDVRQISGLDHPLWVYNKLRPYSDEVTSMWVQSSPEVLFAVMDQDERKAQKAIDEIQVLNRYFNRRHFTEENLQLIAKMGQFCGNYHFEHWYDADAGDGLEWYEEYAPLNIAPELWYECYDCENVGEMPENGTCQACGSQGISPVPMPGVDVPDAIQTSAGYKKTGEIVLRPFPAWSQRYSLATGPANSPYRYAEEDIPKFQIEAVYGRLPESSRDERWASDEAMHPERIMRRAARQRGGIEYGEDDTQNVLIQRFWYQPEMLALYQLDKPVTLLNGEQIPAGERLSDVFPDGMCIITAPGLPYFLNVIHENHTERFTDGRYGITLGQAVGHGIEDGVEAQRQTNILKSGTFRYLQKTLQPSVAVNGRVFTNSNLFNRVDNVIPINNSALPDGTHVGHHFAHVVPPAINPQAFAYLQDMNSEIQAALKAYNSSGDFAGVQNATATAAKIGVAKSASAHNIYLALYAGVVKEVAVKRILLAQKHYENMRVVHDIDSLTGERHAREITTAAIQSDFMAWVKTGSFMPNMEMEKRAAFMEGANVISVLAPLGMVNPASLRKVNEIFGTDFTFERQTEKIEECEEAIDGMLQAYAQFEEQAQQMAAEGVDPLAVHQMMAILPQNLAAIQPVNPYTLGHDTKIEYYRDWLGSRAGREAPEAIQRAVEIKIGEHYAALIQEQQFLAAAASAGPMAVQAMQMQQQAAMMPPEQANGKNKKSKKHPAQSATGGEDQDLLPVNNPMMANPQQAVQPQNPMMSA